MAHVERRGSDRWRARYRTPDGKERSRTFVRKVDADRFLTSVEHEKLTGAYVDPAAGRLSSGATPSSGERSRSTGRPPLPRSSSTCGSTSTRERHLPLRPLAEARSRLSFARSTMTLLHRRSPSCMAASPRCCMQRYAIGSSPRPPASTSDSRERRRRPPSKYSRPARSTRSPPTCPTDTPPSSSPLGRRRPRDPNRTPPVIAHRPWAAPLPRSG